MTEQEKRAREREALSVEYVMKTENGREFVWSLLSKFGLYRSATAAKAIPLAINEGKRQAALQLLDLITEYAEDSVDLMTKEARARATLEEKNHDTTRSNTSTGSYPDSISALDSIGGSYKSDAADL